VAAGHDGVYTEASKNNMQTSTRQTAGVRDSPATVRTVL